MVSGIVASLRGMMEGTSTSASPLPDAPLCTPTLGAPSTCSASAAAVCSAAASCPTGVNMGAGPGRGPGMTVMLSWSLSGEGFATEASTTCRRKT